MCIKQNIQNILDTSSNINLTFEYIKLNSYNFYMDVPLFWTTAEKGMILFMVLMDKSEASIMKQMFS